MGDTGRVAMGDERSPKPGNATRGHGIVGAFDWAALRLEARRHAAVGGQVPLQSAAAQLPNEVCGVVADAGRSSGPGGQNVNKVNTRAQIRINLEAAVRTGWLEREVVDRLAKAEASRVTAENELVVAAQEARSQRQNRQASQPYSRIAGHDLAAARHASRKLRP